jgi:hypothetical protein
LSSKLRWLLFSCWPRQGFHSTILWCSQSGNHSQNNLAKFGYALDMKVGKIKNKKSFYILCYLLELIKKKRRF